MMARALALNGASKVYIIGRRSEVLSAAAHSVPTGNIIPIVGDVTSKDSLLAAVKHIESETGYVNVVIANSGVAGPQTPAPSPDVSLADFAKGLFDVDPLKQSNTFEVNVTATWYTVAAFLPLLDAGNAKDNVPVKSQVIATSSVASFSRSNRAGFAYGQSKAAVTHMMKQLATSLVPYGIRSNVLAPGIYPSDLSGAMIERLSGGGRAVSKNLVPVERFGTEEDMAGAVLFLCSRAGGYLNGSVLLTDGGGLSVLPSTY